MRRQRASVAGHKRVQPRQSLGMRGIIVVDPLAEQQPLDAVAVLDPLLDEPGPLAAQAALALSLRAGRHHHRAHPLLAARMGDERAQQGLAVDLVALGAPMTPRHRNRGRINDVARKAVLTEQPVQPEAVEPGFGDNGDRHRCAEALRDRYLQPLQQLEECCCIAAGHTVLGELIPRPSERDPCPAAESGPYRSADRFHSLGPGISAARRAHRHKPARFAQFE